MRGINTMTMESQRWLDEGRSMLHIFLGEILLFQSWSRTVRTVSQLALMQYQSHANCVVRCLACDIDKGGLCRVNHTINFNRQSA